MTQSSRRLTLSASLVERIRRRDEAAFRELFDQAWPPLFAIAATIVQSRDVAEDVVQDALIRLWRQGERLDAKIDLGSYLAVAVRNTALNALRSDERMRQRSATLALITYSDEVDHVAPADAGIEWDEEMAELRRILATLTEHQRVAFTLRYHQGMTNAEIARVLGISLKGAEQLTARLKKLLWERWSLAK
jgi:RNA polymerase sigma-70 factor (ECF subfamily)